MPQIYGLAREQGAWTFPIVLMVMCPDLMFVVEMWNGHHLGHAQTDQAAWQWVVPADGQQHLSRSDSQWVLETSGLVKGPQLDALYCPHGGAAKLAGLHEMPSPISDGIFRQYTAV